MLVILISLNGVCPSRFSKAGIGWRGPIPASLLKFYGFSVKLVDLTSVLVVSLLVHSLENLKNV